jgi:hypothetical protein
MSLLDPNPLVSLGQADDSEATDDGSVIALLKRLRTLLSDDGSYYSSGTSLQVKQAFDNVDALSTDSELVASVTSKSIRVIALVAVCGDNDTDITFNTYDGTNTGTAISPLFANGAHGGEVLPPNPYGWFTTNPGEALSVTTGSGSTTGISVTYVEV